MNFNFDESSREWRKNKINVGKGYFQYKCSVEGCKDVLYRYTTQSKYFDTFATEFDLLHRNHPISISLLCSDMKTRIPKLLIYLFNM